MVLYGALMLRLHYDAINVHNFHGRCNRQVLVISQSVSFFLGSTVFAVIYCWDIVNFANFT